MIYSGKTVHLLRTPPKPKQKNDEVSFNITPATVINASSPSDNGSFNITPATPNDSSPSDAGSLNCNVSSHTFAMDISPETPEATSHGDQRAKRKSISRNRRPKSSEADLRAHYLDEDYVSILIGSKRLRLYDGGQRTTCHSKCPHQCQRKFSDKKEELKEMLRDWWGEGVDNAARKVMLRDDLLMMADPAYAINRTMKWTILGEEVCQNFYLRARGVHRSKVANLQDKIFSNQLSSLSASCDQRKAEDER